MSEEIVGLILAAGGGTRMYPFSRAVPKEIYPLLGKAVIEHCVENLKEGGIRKIFIVVGYQKGALMDYIGDGSLFGVKVAYLYQLERKGIGHAILQAEEWINTPFVTLLGDSFIEPKKGIKTLIELHEEKKPLASLLLFKVRNPADYGVVKVKEHDDYLKVEDLIEKPTKVQRKPYQTKDGCYYALCGAYVFEPSIFKYIKKTSPGRSGEIQITDSLALAARKGEKIIGLELSGKYLDMGKWKTVLQIEKELLEKSDVIPYIKNREKLSEEMRRMA